MDPETPTHYKRNFILYAYLNWKTNIIQNLTTNITFRITSIFFRRAVFWNKVIISNICGVNSKFHFSDVCVSEDPPLCSSTVTSLLKHHIEKNHLCPCEKTTFFGVLFRILFLIIRIFPERSARCCFWRLILSNETGANRPKLFSRPYLSFYEKNTGISRVKYVPFTFWRTVTQVKRDKHCKI